MTKLSVQLTLFGSKVTKSVAAKSIHLKAHTRMVTKRTISKPGKKSKSLKPFVAKDDCKASVDLAFALHMAERKALLNSFDRDSK